MRLIAGTAFGLCVMLVALTAQGCSKPSTDTGSAGAVEQTKRVAAARPGVQAGEQKGGGGSAGAESELSVPVGTTADNLQTAYNEETNASARFAEFAKKADEEGYQQVAALFRAASRAEEIRASGHAALVTTLGGTPTAELRPVEAKSTQDNIQTALTEETYEVGTMYPEFMRVAEREKSAEAARSFSGGPKAEAEHSKLYTEALRNPKSWKVAAATILVCPGCGYTTKNPRFNKCPVCSTKRSEFEEFK